jgi:hypothetical protein
VGVCGPSPGQRSDRVPEAAPGESSGGGAERLAPPAAAAADVSDRPAEGRARLEEGGRPWSGGEGWRREGGRTDGW